MDLSMIFDTIDRRDAFRQYGNESFESGARIGFIIYSTQQYIIGVLLLSLLLLPLYYNEKKAKVYWLTLGFIIVVNIIFIGTYQKRQQLLELSLILLIFIFYYRKLLPGLIPRSKIFSILIITSLVAYGVSLGVFNSTISRLTQSIEKIDSFDRISELRFALNKFSVVDIIFGKGIGSEIEGTLGGNNLHIGYGTLLMKGGLFLLIFYFSKTVSNIIYCFKKSKKYPIFYVGVAISFFSLIQLSYAPGWGWFLTSVITGLAMFSRYLIKRIIHYKYYKPHAQQDNI